MNTYEFTLCPNSEIDAKVDLEKLSITVVRATGSSWVEALDSVDPDCKMYMLDSKRI